MNQNLKKAIEGLPQPPQRQDALADQLQDLIVVANRLGMYDAADFLTAREKRTPTR